MSQNLRQMSRHDIDILVIRSRQMSDIDIDIDIYIDIPLISVCGSTSKEIEIKSDCLKTWLFRKDRVVRFWEDLHIFKLKPVSGHLKPQKISAPNNKKNEPSNNQ